MVGDRVLAEFAIAIGICLRPTDTVGRWGGEEFVAVLPETGPEEAFGVAERIRQYVERNRFPLEGDKGITCSIGIGCMPDDSADTVGLIEAADGAMYEAKRQGRDRRKSCLGMAKPLPLGRLGPLKAQKLDKREYEKELSRLQVELVRLQEWIAQEGLKVVVLFEGRDTAGKGGVIQRITERTNPRVVRTVALGVPSDRERSQWYFQRYVAHLPAAGEMVLFDRSWYNRAGVERVMGFCSEEEYEEFMRTCPQFERILQGSGIVLLKYWLSVSDEEQERRFKARQRNPGKRWKLSAVDLEARARWVDYAEAKDEMFAHTDSENSPWFVVEADDKRTARLNLIAHLLEQIPYERVDQGQIKFPPRQERPYARPPRDTQTFVPERYRVR